ncbi:MAG: rod shape-determining protein [Patescibacteria group bacterium]
MGLLDRFYKNVGIDLGTANSLVYLQGQGITVNEPTLVAVNIRTNQILAIGHEAKKMLDRTPSHISLIKPLMAGVISDFETTQEILKYFLSKANSDGFMPRYHMAAISVPSNLTEVERKSVEDAVISAGVSKVLLVEESIAAAVGARLPMEEATANMVINIGGGTSEIAIISVGGTVVSRSLKIAGQRLNDDIMRFVREEFKLLIGEPTAENLKVNIGSAINMDEKMEMAVRGRDITSGLPKEIIVKGTQVRAAISRSLKILAEEVKLVIEEAPPELVGDILEKGIHLSGGGSLLKGLDKYIEKEITVKTDVVDDPLTCVVRGLGIIIENLPKYQLILSNQEKPKPVNL